MDVGNTTRRPFRRLVTGHKSGCPPHRESSGTESHVYAVVSRINFPFNDGSHSFRGKAKASKYSRCAYSTHRSIG